MADAKTMTEFNLSCPVPRVADDRIVLAHGGGGRLTHQLIEKIFLPAFSNAMLEQRHDGAVVPVNGSRVAFTTDSFVVRPLMFPGGNIGDLAVNGTVNDLAMCGARPLYLSAGFILEEGLEMETLRTVVKSMQVAAARAGVKLVTGDTKVVDKGKGDGIFINTSGIGLIHELPGLAKEARPGAPPEKDESTENGVPHARPEPSRRVSPHLRDVGVRAASIGPASVQPGDAVI